MNGPTAAVADVVDKLIAAGIDVTADRRARKYGQGRCWVILSDYTVGTYTIGVTAIAAVTAGHDIAGFSSQVWDALAPAVGGAVTDGVVPVAADWDYNTTPLPAAQPVQGQAIAWDPADVCRITVATGRRLGATVRSVP